MSLDKSKKKKKMYFDESKIPVSNSCLFIRL